MLLLIYTLTAFYTQSGALDASMTPVDPYLFVGETLELTCASSTEGGNLTFRKGNDELLPADFVSIVDKYTSRVTVPNVTVKRDEGTYSCWLPDWKYVGSQSVIIDYSPTDVLGFHCVVHDYVRMTCEWKLGARYQYPRHLEVSLYWRLHFSTGDFNQCPQQMLTSCTFYPDKVPFDMNQFQMKLRIRNKYRNDMEVWNGPFLVDAGCLVKPKPVSDLKADVNNTCMKLVWGSPRLHKSNLYRIRYKIRDIAVWKQYDWQEVNTTYETITICNLWPYTGYRVQVAAIPIDGKGKTVGYWSDRTERQITTTFSLECPIGSHHIMVFRKKLLFLARLIHQHLKWMDEISVPSSFQ